MFTSSERTTDGDAIVIGAPGNTSVNDYHDPFDDVFGSAPGSPVISQHSHEHQRPPADELSDIPRLRSIHVTNGYREGISAGKEQSLQAGFDEGYALGAEYGHLTGWIKGVLEALLTIAQKQHPERQAEVQKHLADVETELTLLNLFSPEYFGGDGIWTYEVPGSNDSTTFRSVAAAHPLLVKWKRIAVNMMTDFNLDIETAQENDDQTNL